MGKERQRLAILNLIFDSRVTMQESMYAYLPFKQLIFFSTQVFRKNGVDILNFKKKMFTNLYIFFIFLHW